MLGAGPLGPEQSIPVVVAGDRVGTIALRLPEPGLNPQDVSFRSSVNRLLVLGGLIAGILALVLGIFLARRTLGPAREMTEAAQALASGDRSHRVAIDTTVELGAMGEAFNKMADTIEEEDQLRRLFATDVAHELRTPLAIQRTQLEAIQDGISEPTPEVVASLHEENLRLTRLVEDLETLASAEAAHFSMKPREMELRATVEAVASEFAGPYESKGVILDMRLEEAVAFADPTRVSQIVSNLLSNALKFTPAGGQVVVSVGPSSPWAELRVEDTGAGIPPDEITHVFDRFYRGRSPRAGGSGIGLTVVRELVRAHGGTVDVGERPGGGTVFTVCLPESSPLDVAAPGSHQQAGQVPANE
jgi:two-component system, OmpR family, sensor histidine kinase BaeS